MVTPDWGAGFVSGALLMGSVTFVVLALSAAGRGYPRQLSGHEP